MAWIAQRMSNSGTREFPAGAEPVDIRFRDGLLALGECAATGPAARRVIDLRGRLVIPPLVDAHMHLDTALTLDPRRPNRSGTLLEGIGIWAERKRTMTTREILGNAREVLRWMVAQGTLHVRCHVDVGTPDLTALRALLELRQEVGDVCTLQLVAFPQDGLFDNGGRLDPERLGGVRRAMELGCDLVGGIPHHERTADLGRAQIHELFRLADEFDADVDMHCDETDDPASRFSRDIALAAVAHGRQGRVTVSHCTAMAGYDPSTLASTARLLADADVGVVANPFVNVVLQGRSDTTAVRRGMAPLGPLLHAGVRVGLGQDSVVDPWFPLGTGDMLAVAQLAALLGHLTGHDQLARVLDPATTSGAGLLGLGARYGLREGRPADLVVLDADDPVSALRLLPARLHVFRGGREVARTDPAHSQLTGGFAPGEVSFGREPAAARTARRA